MPIIYRAMMIHSNNNNSHNHYHQYHIYRQLHYQYHSYHHHQHHSHNQYHSHHLDHNHLQVTIESPNMAKAGSSIPMNRFSGWSYVSRRSLLVAHSSLPSKSSREQLVSLILASYYCIHTFICMYTSIYICVKMSIYLRPFFYLLYA
jgi:hypothetical protein